MSRARTGLPLRLAGLIFISLGVAMIDVDATIVNVAIPQIIKDLDITSSDAQWVQDVYTLVFAALLLVAGRVADRLGRRLVFLTGIAVFTTGSVLAASSGAARGALFVVRLGIAFEIAGVLGLGLVISVCTAPWELIIPLLVYGAGIGLAIAQLAGVVLADVPISQSGQGSGTQSTARQVGSALGIAILGAILFGVLHGQLRSELAGSKLPPPVQAAISASVTGSAGASIADLKATPATAAAARDAQRALSTATRWTAVSAAGFVSLGLAASLSLGASRRPLSGTGSTSRRRCQRPGNSGHVMAHLRSSGAAGFVALLCFGGFRTGQISRQVWLTG